jgi:hypothetical protein
MHSGVLPILIILLISAISPTCWAGSCLFYKSKESCTLYTDSGSCIWNAQAEACLDGGPSLPSGTVGVAIVGLNPESVPLELQPGPAVSFGNVSLVNGSEITVAFGEEKSLNVDENSEDEKASQIIADRSLKALEESPAPELSSICGLSPVTGRCRGLFPRWYYDQDQGRCLPFTYGGCGGNENNFASRQVCESFAQELC